MKNLFPLVLLGILLSSCRTSLITDLTVPSGSLLFKDDFSDPASGWPKFNGAAGSEGFVDGSYVIQVDLPQYDLWAVPGQAFGDVNIEVDATKLSGPEANRFGLICRFRDKSDFYFFIISSDGYYGIGKTVNGAESLLGQEAMAYSTTILPGVALNRLRFDCIGNALRGYVNNQVIAVASDGDISNGDVGLLVGAFGNPVVRVAFRNFVVTKP
jgi:hypothetical protein